MHDTIESYCVTQALSGKDAAFFKKGGKDYAAFKLNSIMFYKQRVIVSNEWFLLQVQDRFVKKIISLLIRSGISKDSITTNSDGGYSANIYVIDHPDKFIPCLMKFEIIIEDLNKKAP
ncbi:hypothetical protein D3C76_230550 [compost metagenome]